MKKYITLVLSLVLLSFASQAATWYSVPAGGDASVLTNWWSTAGGTGTNPISFTTPGDVWTIQSTMTCSNTNFAITGTVTATSGSFTLPAGIVSIGGDLVLSGTANLQSAGAATINLGGNLNLSGTAYMYNSPSWTLIVFNNTSSTLANPQTISYTSTSGSGNYYDIAVNAGCVVQLLTNFSTLGSNTIDNINGTLVCGTYTLNGSDGVSVNSGATIYTANTAGINGSITGGGTLSGNANYIFNGTTAQVTGSNLPTSQTDTLTINNIAGVTLSGNVTTTGILALTSGILHTGNFTMGTPGTPGAVIGASATNYVAGSLSKTITGFTTVNYEVGDTDYAPMQLTFDVAGTAGSIGVRCSYGFDPNQNTSAISSTQIVNHYWTITNSGAAGPTTVSPKATYNLTDILGGSNANFLYQKYSSGAWLGSPLPATNTSSPYTSAPATTIPLASVAGDYIFGFSAPCTAPTAQPTNLTLTPTLYTITGSFTAAAPPPDNYLVVMTTTNAAPSAPVNGTLYTAGTSALGGTIISVSSSTTFTVTGLPTGTPYWFWIYSYNSSCTGGPLYLTGSPLTTATSTTTCAMNGIYSVGPTGNYPTLAAAIASLTALGQAGPVALEIQTTYTGEAYPITIGPIPCASPTNNLTIRPQGTMTIAGNTATPMIDLNGAQYVIIDGRVGSTGTTKALTILDTNQLGMDIRFINDASTNQVKYCTLKGSYYTGNTTNNQGTILFSTGVTTGNDNNRIDNCDLLDGPINTPQVAIMSLGTNGKENDHDTVSNCNIANFFSAPGATDGILLSTGTSTWTITNNKFYQTNARAFTGTNTQRAIYISNTTSGQNFTITGNTIGYSSNTGTGTDTMTGAAGTIFQGIYLNAQNSATVIPSSIQGNTIAAISFSTTSATNATGGFLCGIDIASGSANVGNITPNVIGSATGTGSIYGTSSGAGGAIVGISTSAATPAIVNIQNNIIGSITDTATTAAKSAGVVGIQASSTAAVTISGNSIGSTTTPNSINAAMVATVTTAQLAYGINASVTVPCTISNNTIANINNAQTSTAGLTSGIFCSGTNGADTITNNTINNISGASANTGITGQTGVSGITCTSTGGSAIMLNTINTISNTNVGAVQSNVSGIGVSGANNGFVQRNKIFDLRSASVGTTVTTPPTAVGILCGSPAAGGETIQNNFISLGSSQTNNTEFVGIENSASSANTVRIYYNSIDIEGTVTTGALPSVCIHRGNNTTTAFTTPVSILDNICVNNRSGGTGKNYAIANGLNVVTANASGWGLNASNYNILNATNTATIGYWSGDQTFATWQTASASDHNSYSTTPVVFTNVATGDLHINMGTTPNNIESHAVAISTITTDYDNQVRPGPQPSVNGGGTAPDIGADEFDGTPIDNLAPVINYTALLNTCNTGDVTFTANVVDSSGVPLAGSGTEPRVYYKKNSVGAWYSHPATLSSGTQNNGNWFFDIVAADMGGVAIADTIFYYVIAQDDLGNVGSNPSVGLVASNVNSVTTAPATPNFYLIAQNLSGTYTVGGGGYFHSLTQAVNIYNVACLSGPVIFELTDAAYPNETFPITIGLNPEANSTNTLTIEPAPGVAAAITGTTTSTAIIKMLNARYITMDGLNTGGASLSLINTNTGVTSNIWLASTPTTGPGCKHITLNNMTLTGGSNGTTSDWCIMAGADGAAVNSNAGPDIDTVTIHGNTFLEAGYGIYTKGTTAVSTGGFDGWSIDSNTFGPSVYSTTTNFGYNAMFLQGMVNASVTNNTMQNIGLTTSSSQCVGIYLASAINGITIDHNTIENITSDNSGSSTGSTCAIEVNNGVLNTTISRNVITGISDLATGGYAARGVIVNTASNTGNTSIVNNMISDIWSYSDNPNIYWPVGIDIEGTSGSVNVLFNSVNLFGSHTGYTSVTGSACLLVNSTGTGINVTDNIFENAYINTTTATFKGWAIYSADANSVFSGIDYNDYYVTSSNVLGNIGGTDRATIAAIQTGFGGNVHSINSAPIFVTNTNLHLQIVGPNVPLIAGIPAGGVTTDIDGTARSITTPVIGAHEVAIAGCFNVTAGTVTPTATAFCFSGVDTLSLIGSTQAAGLAYQWESSADSLTNWTIIPTATNATYMPTVTSTTYYRVVITCLASSQADSAAVKVKINPLPVIHVTPTGGGYCSGQGSVTMVASGAASYLWTPANGLSSTNTASVIASPVATTFYTVTGTDTNGCSNIHVDTINVTNTPPHVVITPNIDTFCSGNSVMLIATSALPDTVISMDFNSGLGAWIVDNTGTTNFNAIAPWQLHPDGYVSPEGDTYHSPDNSQFVSTNSDNGGNGLTDVSNLTSPAFSLAGYNSATLTFQTFYESWGADNTIAVEVSVNGGAWSSLQSYIGTSIGSSSSWGSESVNMTPYIGQSNVKLRWDYNSTWGFYWAVDNIVITGSGSYNSITWAPNANLYNDVALTTPYTGAVLDTVYSAPTATTQTTYIYTATATNGGCTDTGTTKLTVVPALVVDTLTGGGSYCIGGSGIAIGLNTSTSGISYQLYNNNTGSPVGVPVVGTGSAISFGSQDSAGTYYVVATNGYCNSTMTDSATVIINPLPTVNPITGSDSVCVNASITLVDTSGGGTGAWTSVYTGTATVTSGGIVTGVAAGADTIKYALTNSCGTTTVDTVITVNPLPVPVITAGGVANLSLSTGTYVTYQWFVGGNPITGATNQTDSAMQNGSYTVEVTDSNGCIGTSAVQNVTTVGVPNIISYNGSVTIYPNPNNGTFVISGSISASDNKAQIEITNVAGQVILKDDADVSKGTINKQVKLDPYLASGMYHVKIISDRQTFVLPFVKQ